MSDPEVMSFAQFAALLGKKQSYVRQLRKEDRLVVNGAGLVLVDASLELIAATRDPSKAGVAERHAAERSAKAAATVDVAADPDADLSEDADTDADADLGAGYGGHALRRAKALADKEEELAAKAKLERLIKEGKLLWREQVESANAIAYGLVRQALESTRRQVAPELAAIDDEDRVDAVLADREMRMLADLSKSLVELARRSAE